MIKQVQELEGVYTAKFDFCELGMTAKGDDGVDQAAKKRTTVMTSSKHIAEVLRQAQCSGLHKHVQLLHGKAGPCQKYPDKFVKLIALGVQRELDDVRWRAKVTKQLDITASVEALMSVTEELETEEQELEYEMHAWRTPTSWPVEHAGVCGDIGFHTDEPAWRNSPGTLKPLMPLSKEREKAVPPHEDDVQRAHESLYSGQEFVDDISGAPLDKSMAVKARRVEIDFPKGAESTPSDAGSPG